MIYFISDNEYAILETKYIAKIYDFDRSSFTSGYVKNNILDKDGGFCENFGMCSNYNPYFDPHTLAYYLNVEFGSISYIKDFVNEVVRNKDYLGPGCCTFPGRMCRVTPTGSCSKNFVPNAGDIYDFTDLWDKTNVFERFKRSLSKDGFAPSDIPIASLKKFDAVPEKEFDGANPNVYFSQLCSQPPMMMANKLWNVYNK
jgi:hypothetical protein